MGRYQGRSIIRLDPTVFEEFKIIFYRFPSEVATRGHQHRVWGTTSTVLPSQRMEGWKATAARSNWRQNLKNKLKKNVDFKLKMAWANKKFQWIITHLITQLVSKFKYS